MTFEEACLYCATVFGSSFSYGGDEGDFFICPECGEPVLHDDYNDGDFSECPICGFNFMEGEE